MSTVIASELLAGHRIDHAGHEQVVATVDVMEQPLARLEQDGELVPVEGAPTLVRVTTDLTVSRGGAFYLLQPGQAMTVLD